MLSYSEKNRVLRLYRDPNNPLSFGGIEPFRKDLQENYNIKVSTREIKNILSEDNTFQKYRVKKSKDYGSYNPTAPKEAFLLDHLDWIGKPKKILKIWKCNNEGKNMNKPIIKVHIL